MLLDIHSKQLYQMLLRKKNLKFREKKKIFFRTLIMKQNTLNQIAYNSQDSEVYNIKQSRRQKVAILSKRGPKPSVEKAQRDEERNV